MLNTDEIQDGLWEVLQTIVGEEVPVIIADQSAPIPDTDFVTFKILGVVNIGRKRIVNNKCNTELFDIITDNEMAVTIDAFGANSKDIIAQIAFHLANNPVYTDLLLSKACLAIKDTPNIIDTTQFLETSWEQRNKVDVMFFASQRQTVDLGYIEQVQLNGELECTEYDPGVINIPNQ